MSALKKLASDTALYGISSILGRVINYGLVALHTKVFLPSQLSTQIELYAAVGVLNILYTYGMETTFFRYAAKNKDQAEKYYNLVQTAILCSSMLMSAVLILLANPTSHFMQYESGSQQLIVWLAIIVAIDAIVAIPFARLRLEKKAQKFVVVRMTNIVVNVGLNFFFLSFCKGIYEGEFLASLKPIIDQIYNSKLGPGYIVLANLIANALFIPMLWKELTRYKFEFDKTEFKKLWIYAYPILIMGFAGTINVMADRLLLRHLLPIGFYQNHTTKDALGIYGSCYKLSIFMALATQAFRYAAEPFFFSKAEDRNAPALFAEIMKWFVIVCITIWLGVSLNIDFIGSIFLRQKIYAEGLKVVPILLLANLFLGIYNNLSIWFKLSDKTGYGTLITFIGAGIVLVFNFILVPYFGYMGCAITFLLSSVSMTVICYLLGQKHYPIPYQTSRILCYIGLAWVLIYIAAQFKISNPWLSVPYHTSLFVLFMVGILIAERQALPARLRQKVWFFK